MKSGFCLTGLLLFCLFSSLASYSQDQKPNILWIVCEDISPFIGVYGHPEIKTPNIDQLAKEGIRFTRAYTTAGVCAPSRSTIITGMYQTSIGTQHMRTAGDSKYQPVPSYSAVIPEYIKCFPEYLRKAGYYCTNNFKQDYQFEAPVTVWDESSPSASFINRPATKPFFSIFNLAITHESMLFPRKDSLLVDPQKISVPPLYPDTKTVRHDIARLYSNVEMMDKQVGEIIQLLKSSGSYDNTIIFFYSDHGGALPWMKREILERGTHIPLIIRYPKGLHAGTINNDLVSAVDFAPTILSLTGIPIPLYMQGQAFLGAQKSKTVRQYVFAGRDRMDSEYDRVRMVRDKQFRYLFNYMPEKPYYQNLRFRLGVPMMNEILELKAAGKLDAKTNAWFNTKPKEELYDVDNDPYEFNNLIDDPHFKSKADELRKVFKEWNKNVGDQAEVNELEMIHRMWGGKDEAPVTAIPEIKSSASGVTLSCPTKGASIGYRIVKSGLTEPVLHAIQSWDFGFQMPDAKKGNKVQASAEWVPYQGETISLSAGDTLKVNAMRIGFKPAKVSYSNGNLSVDK